MEKRRSACSVKGRIGAAMICGNSILFSSRNQIKGLTTSAALWTCSLIGLSAGAIAITEVEVAADVVLMALWVLLSVDLGVRYLVLRRTA